ncbi:MAG: hypothetical protein EXS36_13200 [Pedosphaera sp.]|nr:hypothetical protein [Pedosphaera sp.]
MIFLIDLLKTWRPLLLVAFGFPAFGQLYLSEFLARNDRGILDEDGDHPDWIEILNSGNNPANLEGWFLTDAAATPTRWRIPAVTVGAHQTIVVFASNKDRAIRGRPLHTNFKLAAEGGHLALIRPDGRTVEHAHSGYLRQLPDISYGLSVDRVVTPLIAPRATARLRIPTLADAGQEWWFPEFEDVTWASAALPVGYFEPEHTNELSQLANSIADFSDQQEHNGWQYGYFNKTGDGDGTYRAPDFIGFQRSENPVGPLNHWDGEFWRLALAGPPFTQLGASRMRPNGTSNGSEHWPIRRWKSPIAGTLRVEIDFSKEADAGTGMTLRFYQGNSLRFTQAITGADTVGFHTVLDVTVVPGDTLDFAVTPVGLLAKSDDTGDLGTLAVRIFALSSVEGLLKTDTFDAMRGKTASAWARIPFVVTNSAAWQQLLLRIRYDDGFAAWLNGVEVLHVNAPVELSWDSSATESRSELAALQGQTFDLTSRRGLLVAGTNWLALQGLNLASTNEDFLLGAELDGVQTEINPAVHRYFFPATPGDVNGVGSTNLGPLVLDQNHQPSQPQVGEPLRITARVEGAFQPVTHVTLVWRVMYSGSESLEMFDDGLHDDGAAGDGKYGAVIPGDRAAAGQMIRWHFRTQDASGSTNRWPPFPDRLKSAEYEGTVVSDASLTNPLPVLHYFVERPSLADSATTRASLFYDGVFYDNVGVSVHGQSSREFPKHSYNFDMNPERRFRYDPAEDPVDDFNLLTTYPDKAKVRNILAYGTFRDSGSPYHVVLPWRVQRNGAFFGDYHWVEDGSESFLKRVGRNPSGALYKAYSGDFTIGSEKKTRKWENYADLIDLRKGFGTNAGAKRHPYLMDNFNIPAMVNYLAATIITGGIDCCHKNYYTYRDSDGTGEWEFMPWDQDLTFGRNWTGTLTYYDDKMYIDNGLNIGDNNTFIAALLADTQFKGMYYRRIRTLMDALIQNTNTPPERLHFERQVAELFPLLEADAALDYAKWKPWGLKQTFNQAIDILTKTYLPARRQFMYRSFITPRGPVPAAQAANPTLQFGTYDVTPVSGDANEEFLELKNPNNVYLDISDWKLTGDIEFTLAGGTVLPPNGSVYLARNSKSFRARSQTPHGGQGLLIQEGYHGQLAARGGEVRLWDHDRAVATLTVPATPTRAQQALRITELMFRPLDSQPGDPFAPEDHQFIELANVGFEELDLSHTVFTGGIAFRFAGSAITRLAAGARVVVVRNVSAFRKRYGADVSVAGEFIGRLDIEGEAVRLEDFGEVVLEFVYDDHWVPKSLHGGWSLVVVNPNAAWTAWKNRTQWTVSAGPGGAPGIDDLAYGAWLADNLPGALTEDDLAAYADPDHDGRSNREEFLLNSDPMDPASPLFVRPVSDSASTGPLMFRFDAVVNREYAVQARETLSRGDWLTVERISAGPARVVNFQPAGRPDATVRFYRVVAGRR